MCVRDERGEESEMEMNERETGIRNKKLNNVCDRFHPGSN